MVLVEVERAAVATAKTRIFGERGRPRAGFETWSTYLFLRAELVLSTGINALINGRILLLFFPLSATLIARYFVCLWQALTPNVLNFHPLWHIKAQIK